jgi:tetratricopeptide (TPR) repeat protein
MEKNQLAIIETAIQLRKAGKLQDSNDLLLKTYPSDPENAYLNYQIAWSFDVLGKESQAVPYYERAIELGLTDPDLEEAYLGLGSTYRALGNYQKAEEVLREGQDKFPTNNGLKVFYAMALFNLQQYSQSNQILLELLAQTSSDQKINDYRKAIAFYADKMNQTWE